MNAWKTSQILTGQVQSGVKLRSPLTLAMEATTRGQGMDNSNTNGGLL
jgi:hypothetical protein